MAIAALLAMTLHALATELSIVATQTDLRAAAGDPNASLFPQSMAFNPVSGKLLLACGGANAVILEWDLAAGAGAVLAADADWGGSPFGAVYIPSRGSYMVADGGDDVIREVLPEVVGQTPPVFVPMTPPTFPAGGMVQHNGYAYYKNQWSGIQQTINRFTLVGTNGVDSEYVPFSAIQAVGGNAITQQIAIDSAGDVVISVRASTHPLRGIFRWDAVNGVLVPLVLQPQIIAYTGQNLFQCIGLTIDAYDNVYFGDVYSGDILRLDRHGQLSTFVTKEAARELMNDPGMQFSPAYMVVSNDTLYIPTGNISGHLIAARIPPMIEMVTVPGTDYEVGGPTYPYAIGRYEVTNAEYCVFLNDAERTMQTNPADPRCSNMWIDPTNGDVYMTDVTGYPAGTEWIARTLYKTSDVPDSKIKRNPAYAAGQRYYVVDGFHRHPVGTVSWYGAAKFCNWLTVASGMDASQVCYREGPNKEDWYAITAADFSTNGMLATERADLVRNFQGYRLPMDGVNVDHGGPGNATSWNMTANAYNEWYKAAAFDPAAPDAVRPGPGIDELVPADHWTFGFGSDTVTAADANLGFATIPFLETTPVGWFDGVNLLTDGTTTNDTGNRYGIYDLCGNAAEWINDTALEYPWSSNYRGVRGGRFTTSDPEYATTSLRQIMSARYYAENSVGFRLARSFGYGDFDGDAVIAASDFAFFADAMTGPSVSVVPGAGHEACDYDVDDHVDLRDFAALQRSAVP